MIAEVECPWSFERARFHVHDARGHIQAKWTAGVFYEQEGLLRDAWERFKTDPPVVVLDVGACVGNHSIWFAKAFDATVVAFEPHREYRLHAVENVALNGLDQSVAVFGYAIGSCTRRVSMRVVGNEGMAQTTAGDAVQMTTLDSLTLPPPDVIKIDVEGGEMNVLAGARKLIRKYRPVLYVEGHRLALEMWCEENDYQLAATFNATPTHRLEPQ